VAHFHTLEGLLSALQAGLGVHLATEPLVTSAGADLVWRQLDEVAPLEHFVARRDDDTRPAVAELVDTIVDTFHD
jgi:DNA-binding transcriptional LysR family regulator